MKIAIEKIRRQKRQDIEEYLGESYENIILEKRPDGCRHRSIRTVCKKLG